MNSNTREALQNFIYEIGMLVVELNNDDGTSPVTRQDVMDAGRNLHEALDADETIT